MIIESILFLFVFGFFVPLENFSLIWRRRHYHAVNGCKSWPFHDTRVQWGTPRWRSGRTFASHAGDLGSIFGRDVSNSLKQVMTVPLPNARQQVWVSRIVILRGPLKRVGPCHSRCSTLKNPHCSKFFSVIYLLWHGTPVNVSSPTTHDTHTHVTERLAVKLSLPVLTTYVYRGRDSHTQPSAC